MGVVGWGVGTQAQPPSTPSGQWYRGNTHVHTLESDGDTSPDDVARWYRTHYYDFVIVTDHRALTKVDALNAAHGADGRFLVIPGEEVGADLGRIPIHVNALGVDAHVPPVPGTTVADTLRRNVAAIRAAGGVPQVNHPYFGWAMTADDLVASEARLFEIFNGHPFSNNYGGSGRPPLEELWDSILSRGHRLYAVAADDAHHFKRPDDPTATKPGTGFVMVRAPRLEARAIVAALERGDFYASTGVILDEYTVEDGRIRVKVRPAWMAGYRIQFIGRDGVLLDEVSAGEATYRTRGDEGYVRVKVLESNGAVAWLQPVFVGGLRRPPSDTTDAAGSKPPIPH